MGLPFTIATMERSMGTKALTAGTTSAGFDWVALQIRLSLALLLAAIGWGIYIKLGGLVCGSYVFITLFAICMRFFADGKDDAFCFTCALFCLMFATIMMGQAYPDVGPPIVAGAIAVGCLTLAAITKWRSQHGH